MRTRSRSTVFSLFVVAAWLIMAFQPAQAQTFGQAGLGFAAFGPAVAPPVGNGFPVSYTDTNGISLAQCLDNGPNCLPDPTFVAPAGPFPANFPEEFFYWIAGPIVASANIVVVEYAMEGGFTVTIADGQQAVFQRIRYRLIGLTPNGTLTIDHPWGTDIMPVDALGEVNSTLDIPGLVVEAIVGTTAQTATAIGPFLTAVAPAPPAGFVGTCGGSQTVTGGPLRNDITISGAGVNLTTTQWDICGKLFAGGVANPTVHMHRDATGAGRIDFDVIGLSATGEVDVAGVGAPLPGVVEPLALSPAIGRAGAFVASISLLPGVVIPDNVVFTVDRATGAPPAGTLGTSPNIAVTDQVLITDAVLDDAANTLTVTANSSNLFAPVPTLSVTAPVTGAVGVAIPNVTTIPATVTVTSTDGGTATAPVRVINVVTPGVPGAPPAAGGGGGGGCFIDSLF